MSRSPLIGCFVAVTLISVRAFAQPAGEVPAAPPAAAPVAAQPAPKTAVDNPYGDRATRTRPIAKKSEATKAVPAKSEPLANPAKAPPSLPQPQQVTPEQPVQPAPPPPAPPVPPPAHDHEHAPATPPGHDQAASGHQSASSEGHATHESAEPPYIDDVNWFYGLLGENDEVEPNLLYRPTGTPVPFLATLINWGILVGLIVMLAKKQLPAALAKRKATIVAGMQEAQKLRDESASLLRGYEEKLAKIDSDIERIKVEMQKAGEQERERILAEAVERRSRMERDARRLIDTELEAIKGSLRREVVQAALSTAKKSIENQMAATDQQRLFDEAMSSLKKLPPRSLGGQA